MGFFSCNELRNNSDCRFVALFSNYSEISSGISTNVYIALQTIELLSNIYSILVFSLSANHVFQSKIFHTNFISPIICFYVHTYMFTFTRVVLSMFQNGFIEVGDSTDISYRILIFFSELRFYQFFIAIYSFVLLTIERVCATVFIRDYEVNTRRYISVTLISFAIITAQTNAYFTSRGLPMVASITVSSIFVIGYTLFIVCVSATISLINQNRNATFKRRLEVRNDLYALSMKFQLRENFRAFRLLRRTSIASMVIGTAMCFDLYLVIIYHDNRNLSSILGALFDTIQGCSFCVLLSMTVFSQPSWRESFATRIGLARWRRPASANSRVHPTSYAATSDIYFIQLGQSWETKYDLHKNV